MVDIHNYFGTCVCIKDSDLRFRTTIAWVSKGIHHIHRGGENSPNHCQRLCPHLALLMMKPW